MPTLQGFDWPKWLKDTEMTLFHVTQSLEKEHRSPTKKERAYANQMWETSQATDSNGDYIIPERYWGDAELITYWWLEEGIANPKIASFGYWPSDIPRDKQASKHIANLIREAM